MKKRLYNTRQWDVSVVVLSLFGLVVTVTFLLRFAKLPSAYGVVESRIPVLSVPMEDPSVGEVYKETPLKYISDNTVTIILSASKNFYFGELRSFAKNFSNTSNKFVVEQQNGEAQITTLTSKLSQWINRNSLNKDKLAVLIPVDSSDMNDVIKSIDELQKSSLFDKVILANGLL
jgi:hypothetical protein